MAKRLTPGVTFSRLVPFCMRCSPGKEPSSVSPTQKRWWRWTAKSRARCTMSSRMFRAGWTEGYSSMFAQTPGRPLFKHGRDRAGTQGLLRTGFGTFQWCKSKSAVPAKQAASCRFLRTDHPLSADESRRLVDSPQFQSPVGQGPSIAADARSSSETNSAKPTHLLFRPSGTSRRPSACQFWPDISWSDSIITTPPGAYVYRKNYNAANAWELVGRHPSTREIPPCRFQVEVRATRVYHR